MFSISLWTCMHKACNEWHWLFVCLSGFTWGNRAKHQKTCWFSIYRWYDLQCSEFIIIISSDQVCWAKKIIPFLGHDLQINMWGGLHRAGWQCVGMGSGPGQVQKLGCCGYTSAHCPPSSSHPVAICSDAGQRNHRRIGVDQTTPQREGEQGGARQGVACHSTSSTGQYRMAWATFSTPSCSYPPCWRQSSPQLKSSSDRICGQNDTCLRRHASLYIVLPPYCQRSSLSWHMQYISFFWLSQLELVLRSGMAKSGSSVVV